MANKNFHIRQPWFQISTADLILLITAPAVVIALLQAMQRYVSGN